MGYQGKQAAHGLRRSALSMLSDQGFSYEASEACLSNKVGNSVSQSYNHWTYLNQRIKIMSWWSAHIAEAQGTSRIDLMTAFSYKRGQRLYEKLGYKKVNEHFSLLFITDITKAKPLFKHTLVVTALT